MTSQTATDEPFHVLDSQDTAAPLVKREGLTATNHAAKKTTIDFGDAGTMVTDLPFQDGGTNAGPSPMLALVGALCGCEAGTFSRTATELGLTYRELEFRAEFRMDARTRTGLANAATHVRTIRLEARVSTHDSLALLARVAAETERRCPVSNLIRDAGVQLQTRWIRDQAGTAGRR
jgi:uncharacterized OsmC-like protein